MEIEINARKKFKLKILEKYDTLTNFARHIGVTRQYLWDINCGKKAGTVGFWEKVGEGLGLTSAEIWELQLEMWRLYKRDQ